MFSSSGYSQKPVLPQVFLCRYISPHPRIKLFLPCHCVQHPMSCIAHAGKCKIVALVSVAAPEDRAIAVRWITSLMPETLMLEVSETWACVGQVKKASIPVRQSASCISNDSWISCLRQNVIDCTLSILCRITHARASFDGGAYVPRQAESIPMFCAMFVLSADENGKRLKTSGFSILSPCNLQIGKPFLSQMAFIA